jgi:DNA-directed RNA polymerase subunit RPC12/RpoP
MPDTIKCSCSHCGAKYRLPAEAQGRTARCKRCGEKFAVPREQSLEDSILTWLSAPEEAEEAAPPPRIISMPGADADNSNDGTVAGKRVRGTIRLKSSVPKEESA